MNKEEQNILFQKLTNNYTLKKPSGSSFNVVQFVDIESNMKKFEGDINFPEESCTYCFDKIFLGVHTDLDKRIINFFNGLGYIDILYKDDIPSFANMPYDAYVQTLAWRRGMELARHNGIKFTREAVEWAIDTFRKNFMDNNIELTPLKYFEEAKNYAFSQILREYKLEDILK